MTKLKFNSDNIENSVAGIDLSNITWKLQDKESKGWDKETCDVAELEYRRFLTLKKIYPKQTLVPNKIIDDIWHQHILDTASYRKDCKDVFGVFIDHYPYFGMHGDEDQKNLQSTFEKTKKLYFEHFNIGMNESFTRCGDTPHPCHVPTSCACRAPGTCK